MKTEHEAWMLLREHASAQLKPHFADRVLRAARANSSPLLVAQFAMCAATAVLCLAAVALYNAGSSGDDLQNVAGWSEISAQATELEQGL